MQQNNIANALSDLNNAAKDLKQAIIIADDSNNVEASLLFKRGVVATFVEWAGTVIKVISTLIPTAKNTLQDNNYFISAHKIIRMAADKKYISNKDAAIIIGIWNVSDSVTSGYNNTEKINLIYAAIKTNLNDIIELTHKASSASD